MIVRNGGSDLERCLASAAPLVDRIVIGDTGSVDDTRSIAQRYGAECFPISWQEDFAGARNQLLERARCDWILVLDADEMLHSSEAAAVLPGLLLDSTVDAYTLERWDYIIPGDDVLVDADARRNPGILPEAGEYPGYLRSYHTRLFRRHSEVFYRGCVHESVYSQIDLLGLSHKQGGMLIHHFGFVESSLPAKRAKAERYLRLALRKVTEEPQDYEAHLQVGITELLERNNPARALPALRQAVKLRGSDSRCWLYSGICLQRLKRLAEAERNLLQAWQLGERSAALYDAMGDIYLLTARAEQALAAYRKAHAAGGLSAVLYAKIGAAEVHVGLASSGLERIRLATTLPGAPAALRDLLALSTKTAGLQKTR